MLRLLSQLENVEGDKKDKETRQFVDMVSSIKKLGIQTEKILDTTIKAEENWFTGNMLKIFR